METVATRRGGPTAETLAAMALAACFAVTGCQREERILDIKAPGVDVKVDRRHDGGVDVDVDRR